MDFEVSTSYNAQIALSGENSSVADMYRIGVTVDVSDGLAKIQRNCTSPTSLGHECDVRIKVIASDAKLSGIPRYDHFWLTFDKGHIRMGRHGNLSPFLDWTDPAPLRVNFIGILTGFGSGGRWKFHSFC
ncbi:C3 and PZP-like alpha-2-macroglobulin domain-containing protein 8 [Diadema antillarum]|uniref:C3 and PZP-like alpha-2-macroglobulin domain-containing protein 8 n=1 Tax=Diadema antillarum TaxID=105358 RepID=UPI003A8935CD